MYGDSGFDSGSPAPVRVGDELEVTIEAVGAKGDGIAKKEGFVLFVPGVQKGDNVRIKITRVLRKVGFAEVVGASEGGQSAETSEESAPAEETGEETPAEEPKEETPAEEAKEESPPQDSEDFGEEEKQQ